MLLVTIPTEAITKLFSKNAECCCYFDIPSAKK